VTKEALIVPGEGLKGNKLGASQTTLACKGTIRSTLESALMMTALTGDRVGAGGAALGEELPEAVGTVRLVLPAGEALARQRPDVLR
jgi:hypothetical protein